MKCLIYICFVLSASLDVSAQFNFFKSRFSFDFNGDGVIRCAILGTGGDDSVVDNSQTCIDLEQMIKNSDPGMPVRVQFEEISQAKTIMGWWYHPDSLAQREAFVASNYDYVFLAENKSVVTQYPELFFEGVSISRQRFSQRKTCIMLLMMDSTPVSTLHDKSINMLTDLTYRVADGCGVKVVPAALSWQEVIRQRILPGTSLLKMRANSFLAASAIWCRVSGDKVPKASMTTGWIVKKTASLLARASKNSVEAALIERHYAGPFRGVVRMADRIKNRYLLYHAGTVSIPVLQDSLDSILDCSGQSAEQHSVADWHASGYDRYAAPFDLVFGSIQEMEPLLDIGRYTSMESVPSKFPDPVRIVYNRNPVNDVDGELALRNLEDLLIDGYNFARINDFIFIPYQVAWARLWSINPDYVKAVPGKSSNGWLDYMLAGMIYSALTGRYQMPVEKDVPHFYTDEYPRGFLPIAVRTGWHSLRQLSELKMCRNTLVTSRRGWSVDRSNPAFVSIRLLEPPVEPVSVCCEITQPGTLLLSANVFEFNHENYNIEQNLRCSALGNGSNIFCEVLINAVSDDKDIDGVSTKHTFLLNPHDTSIADFSFNANRVSPACNSTVMLKPVEQPLDFVNVQIFQNDVETASVCFSPDNYDAFPVSLFPDAGAVSNGRCEVLLKAGSRDGRFNHFEKKFVFTLDYGDIHIPDLKIINPAPDTRIQGPAYVTAEAVAQGECKPVEISLFCGKKRLGVQKGGSIKTGIEMGPPLSRLSSGVYPVWSAVRLENGVLVSSPVNLLTVE